MHLQELDTSVRYQARVYQTLRLTPDRCAEEVLELALDVANGLRINVGQHVGVLAPGQKQFGQQHHLRLYTIADIPEPLASGQTRIRLCVKRCWYLDPHSGERYPGVASHYLCDLQPGDLLTLTGPYGQAFEVPAEPDATLILIGAGTGIAPFRAFVKYLYLHAPQFQGRIWLFHGARTGLEQIYRNDLQDDFAQFYDLETFQAISALSHRPHWSAAIDWHSPLHSRGESLWRLLTDAHTYVYLAGLEQIRDELDQVFNRLAGQADHWQRRKAELVAGGRWVELLY